MENPQGDPIFVGYCPVPKCDKYRVFEGESAADVLVKIRQHLQDNLEDPNHSDIAEMEEWLV